jgi:GTP cyclohydrolase II
MPDVFHWLGVSRVRTCQQCESIDRLQIDNLISMSNMKYDALINSGITVVNRYELSSDLMPADSQGA